MRFKYIVILLLLSVLLMGQNYKSYRIPTYPIGFNLDFSKRVSYMNIKVIVKCDKTFIKCDKTFFKIKDIKFNITKPQNTKLFLDTITINKLIYKPIIK